MTLRMTADDAIAALNTLTGRLNPVGGDNPVVQIFSGVRPAGLLDAIAGQILLVVLEMNDAAAFNPAADVPAEAYVEAVAGGIPDTPALETNVATWFRVLDGAGNIRWDGDVSEPNLAGDLQISSVNIVKDVNVVTVAFRARYPKGE